MLDSNLDQVSTVNSNPNLQSNDTYMEKVSPGHSAPTNSLSSNDSRMLQGNHSTQDVLQLAELALKEMDDQMDELNRMSMPKQTHYSAPHHDNSSESSLPPCDLLSSFDKELDDIVSEQSAPVRFLSKCKTTLKTCYWLALYYNYHIIEIN